MGSKQIVKNIYNSSKNSVSRKDLIDDTNKRPNFEYHNDAYYKLIEEVGFNDFIDDVMEDIDIFLSTLVDEYKVAKKQTYIL